MNKEGFQDALREQFADEIHEAYIECEHEDGHKIDYKKLNDTLTRLMKTARMEGLPEQEFVDLVRSTLPVAPEYLTFIPMKKAA